MFSGQGSQWAAMGAELLANEPVFAATVAEAEPLIARESGFSVTEAMSAPETVTGIDRVQPTLFTFQVALATAMRAYGVQPGAVIGHSLGEAAAAVVAGALSLEDGAQGDLPALTVDVAHRRRGRDGLGGAARPAGARGTGRPRRQRRRGVGDRLAELHRRSAERPRRFATWSRTGSAVRSWPARWPWTSRRTRLRSIRSSPTWPTSSQSCTPMTPKVPYYSATLDDPRAEPTFDAGYWVDNLRQSGEVRGGGAGGAGRRSPGVRRAVAAPAADPRGGTDRPARRHHRRRLWPACGASSRCRTGCAASWRICTAPAPQSISRCCIRAGAWWTPRCRLGPTSGSSSNPTVRARGHTAACTVSVHPLLGAHVRLPEEPERHAWQGEDRHRGAAMAGRPPGQRGTPSFRAAGFCEMALAAAAAVLGPDSEVRDIRFEQMLLLDDETPVSAVASVEAPGVVEFVVETDHEGERTRRAVAVLHSGRRGQQPQRRDISALLAAHPQLVDGAALRQSFDKRGVQFGPAFTGLAAARTAEGKGRTVLAEVGLPGPVRSQQAGYGVHPALLDACFQSVAGAPGHRGRRRRRAAVAAGRGPAAPLLPRPATPATATLRVTASERVGVRGRPGPARRGRERICWPCRACGWAPAPVPAATATACWPNGC